MAEDILHDEVGDGDKVLITHEEDEEELSFEVHKGEASTVSEETEELPSETNGQTNGEAEAHSDEEGTDEEESSEEEASATASDEDE